MKFTIKYNRADEINVICVDLHAKFNNIQQHSEAA